MKNEIRQIKLDKLNLVELNDQELQTIDGGFDIVTGFKLTWQITKYMWKNRDTQFVKDLVAGSDAVYP